MLEKLRIQNFKSWQDTGDIAFGSLTGFFGTNSSGKSSILQFLLMLKQTVESSDRSRVLDLGDDHTYVELGTILDILYAHDDTAKLNFNINWQCEELAGMGELINSKASFAASIGYDLGLLYLQSFNYRLSERGHHRRDWVAGLDRKRDSKGELFFGLSVEHPDHTSVSSIVSNPDKFYIFPFDSYFKNLSEKSSDYRFDKAVFQLERLFKSFYYLGPLREHPSRLYIWGGNQNESVGNRGERAVAALLSSRNQGPTIDMGTDQPKRTVEEHVAHWLKELGLIYSFKVQPIAPNRKEYEVRIQRTAESASVFLTDVGFGVSQILPVLVLLFYVPEGSTVILEQPEIHLHPAVQAGLADVFIDAIKRRKLQIVLESHSEHLLQRLQRRIAEEVIDEEAIKLYFTSIKEGRSELTTLELDEYGNIHNWPAGFFGNAFEEAAAKTKAEMKRKLREQQS